MCLRDGGGMVQAVALFGWLALPMRIVGFLFESIPRSVVSIARIDDLLALTVDPAAEGDGTGAHLPDGPVGLRLDDVHYAFGPDQPPVLDGVSFDVQPGESADWARALVYAIDPANLEPDVLALPNVVLILGLVGKGLHALVGACGAGRVASLAVVMRLRWGAALSNTTRLPTNVRAHMSVLRLHLRTSARA